MPVYVFPVQKWIGATYTVFIKAFAGCQLSFYDTSKIFYFSNLILYAANPC